jgi:hypothetical protein
VSRFAPYPVPRTPYFAESGVIGQIAFGLLGVDRLSPQTVNSSASEYGIRSTEHPEEGR